MRASSHVCVDFVLKILLVFASFFVPVTFLPDVPSTFVRRAFRFFVIVCRLRSVRKYCESMCLPQGFSFLRNGPRGQITARSHCSTSPNRAPCPVGPLLTGNRCDESVRVERDGGDLSDSLSPFMHSLFAPYATFAFVTSNRSFSRTCWMLHLRGTTPSTRK